MKDRRIRKTQQAIHSAFAKLLIDKNINDITIKELCEVADINKSTFYLHYKDIYDCADCLMNYVVDKTLKIMEPYDFTELVNHLPDIMDEILLIFREDRELYIPFFNSSRHSLSLYKIKQLTIEKLLKKTENNNLPRIINKTTISFIVCGIFGVLEQNEFDEITPDATSLLAHKIQNGFIPSKDFLK
ncbi:TetR family transcriptional regulator [Clostridium sp. DL-VIII]|uniref:TetR/AcrR family transcriptional regulator n=1 Tax=Clostridium sp. DL-VIII TaxID=641107 RepID=UPI00023AFDC3|nr:TetR/AcrR family transcriptional regulator [Clostridium sp. DL-VIII]EHI98391.1 TetR family transcriptional regulator [Clostridium sp. DL-VIII]